MPPVRQVSFAGGELSPLLWGRTDLAKYATGARRLYNFFVTRQGAAMSRPGTNVISGTKYSGTADRPVRLIPFISGAQSYVLEFGHLYVRFHSEGANVMDPGSPGNPLELATNFVVGDLPQLQWAQVGDVLTVTVYGGGEWEIRRVAHDDWTIEAVDYEPPEPYFTDVDSAATPTLPPMILEPLPVASADEPEREWEWLVTIVVKENATGRIFETLPEPVADTYDGTDPAAPVNITPYSGKVALYPGKPVTLQRADSTGLIGVPAWWAGHRVIAYNYYRGRGELYGFVGTTKTREFVDTGAEPDYTIQPPRGTNPFLVTDQEGDPTGLDPETPAAVTYFQERRVFGGTQERPAFVFASATGSYTNFDKRFTIHMPGEALYYELAARKYSDIRTMAGLSKLLIGTGTGIWAMSGAEGYALDFDSVDARIVEEIGCSWLPFIAIGETALYTRSKGNGVRALLPAGGASGYQGVDISLISNHLFEDGTITDWTYAEDPYGVIWAVRSDGKLLSLTFSQADEMWAWAQHETDGVVEAVCAVPEGDRDVVYMVVRRSIRPSAGAPFQDERYIEYMVPRDVETGHALDCAVQRNTGGGGSVNAQAGLEHLEGKEVYVTGPNLPVYGPYTVTNGEIEFEEYLGGDPDTPNIDFAIGLAFTAELETLDPISTRTQLRQKNVRRVGVEVTDTRGLKAGPDFSHLTEWEQRSVSDSYDALSAATGLVDITVEGGWGSPARIAIRQEEPLFVTVVGVTWDIDYGE